MREDGGCRFDLGPQVDIVCPTRSGLAVDEEALIDALENGRIDGAGLDVFQAEPLAPGHRLTQLENVVLSPHAGGMAYNGTMRGLEMSVENLESFAVGSPIYVVARGSRR